MNKPAKVLTAVGLLLIAAAAALTGFNLWDNERAGKTADEVLEQLSPVVAEHAEQQKELAALQPEQISASQEEYFIPDYVLDPEMEMPTESINGLDYVGILSIPKLSMELPIISQCTNSNLKTAPCRYSGSVYLNSMVIAAHNFPNFFGSLKNLSPGDLVKFTDMLGYVFCYRVVEIEVLQPSETERMTTGEWDMTLFTCTVGGKTRITVRCELTEPDT